ncbi:23S rRNA (uracil(747)-C(5))-methyltransferase RlmC [Nocardioides houyundeii]|uniref:23S rRNA (uracil(747)-C(5))-methyltransferase RlmC n=1 Tax=Nocardioides houyundeii TaxID=2045452 RepID=UPI000DF28ACC|nr:23S rRNA (uracil(747)-C(5))-methyltransferase RlmC [Nocardioides houyundeii]
MDCAHYDAHRCRSCTLLEVPRADQLAAKTRQVQALLPDPDLEWQPPVVGPGERFRNKAKMVVGGTADAPTLGILDAAGSGIDLRDCPLHSAGLQAALPLLAAFISTAAIAPYDVTARRGELKHLLVTESEAGELMVRFVLRSQEPVTRIGKHLPGLLAALPRLRVVSVNLQPEHKAVLEGEREIVLHGSTLAMRVNDLTLHLRPQSFFQTNTEVAASLYRQAAAWVAELLPVGETAPAQVWDLYCGVGGFALHLARPGLAVTGVEVSAEAVASARTSARELGAPAEFVAADATAWALAQDRSPDLVVVNPPRRGIGPVLAGWLEDSGVRHVLYSSCNAESLARDLAAMPSLRPRRAVLLDMFPQTRHYEVLVLAERTD